MIYKQPKEATTGLTYTRSGAATAWRKDGTLAEFAPNVIRRTDRGVLIEGQRTNIFSGWRHNGTSREVNVGLAPDGTNTMIRMVVSTEGSSRYSGFFSNVLTNKVYSASFWVQADTVDEVMCGLYSTAFQNVAVKILSGPGTVNATSNTLPVIQGLSSTEPTRVSLTLMEPLSGSSINCYLYPRNTGVQPVGTSFLFWGAQMEEGGYATSYIPIVNVGTAATRGVDKLYAADAISKNDFTLLWETKCAAQEVSQWYLASGAQAETIPEHPDEIVADLLTIVVAGAPASVPSLPTAEVSNGACTPPVGVDRVAAFKAVVPWKQGEIYEVTVDVEGLAGSVAPMMSPYASKMKADFSFVTVEPVEHYSFADAPVGQVTRRVVRFGMGLLPAAPVGGVAINVSHVADVAFVRFGALVNYGSEAPDRQSRLKLLTIRNVTAQVAAASLPAQTIQIGTRAPSSGIPISQRRRHHALRKQGPTLTEYLNGVPIKNRQGSTYSNLLIGGEGLEPINGTVETVKIIPHALTDEELVKLTSLNDTTFDYLNPGGVYYYDAGQESPRKSQVVAPISSGNQVVAPISSGRELIL